MQDSNYTPDAFTTVVRRGHAERAQAIGDRLSTVLVAAYRRAAPLRARLANLLAPSSPDEAYLAGARSYAELRQRFNVLAEEHARVAMDVGR